MTQSTPSATSASKRRASWYQHYQQWQASALSISAYCSQHRLTQSSFYLWKQRFGSILQEQFTTSLSWPRWGKCQGWHEYKTTKPCDLTATVNDAAVQ